MMSDIVKLSQYKTDVQSRKVKKSAIEMTQTHFLWENAKTEQETFTRWQLVETQRLFERLAAKPATTEQLKTYNSKLAHFKTNLNTLNKKMSSAEGDYSQALERLKTEKTKLKDLQCKHDKFEHLSNQQDRETALQLQRKEEDLAADEAENIRMTLATSSGEL